jgi:SAM-dependent methyltransferase
MSTAPNPWDQRYGDAAFVYGTEPNDFLREHVGALPEGPILSLAEGEGRNAVFLAEQGYAVTGVDGSAVGLAKAQTLASSRGVALATVVGDVTTFQVGEGAWAAVISIWCHLPSADRVGMHTRVARALRPGGVFLLEHYHPRQLEFRTGGPPDPDLMLTLAELRAAFPGWRELHAFEGERVVHEGRLHTGRSYVTQWIAEKPGG